MKLFLNLILVYKNRYFYLQKKVLIISIFIILEYNCKYNFDKQNMVRDLMKKCKSIIIL